MYNLGQEEGAIWVVRKVRSGYPRIGSFLISIIIKTSDRASFPTLQSMFVVLSSPFFSKSLYSTN